MKEITHNKRTFFLMRNSKINKFTYMTKSNNVFSFMYYYKVLKKFN